MKTDSDIVWMWCLMSVFASIIILVGLNMARDEIMLEEGAQAVTAAKSAFLDAGVLGEAPSLTEEYNSEARQAFVDEQIGDNDLEGSVTAAPLIISEHDVRGLPRFSLMATHVNGEELFRVDRTGEITGEGGRYIGQLNGREVKLLMKAWR